MDFTGALLAFFAVLLGAPALLAIAIVFVINRSWARRNRPTAVRLYTLVSTMAALSAAIVATLVFYAVCGLLPGSASHGVRYSATNESCHHARHSIFGCLVLFKDFDLCSRRAGPQGWRVRLTGASSRTPQGRLRK